MNSKSLLLDYGIPGLVALGAGIVTYMLTGGPEEFPQTLTETGEDCVDEGDCLYSTAIEGGGRPNRLGRATRETDANDFVAPPEWAKELVEYTRALSQEVRLLKESTQINGQYQQEQFMLLSRQVQSALKSNVEVEELPESPPLQTWNLTDWSMQVKCRVLSMLLEKEVESNSTALREAVRDATTVTHSSGNSKLSAACELLMLYLNNLLKNPNMSRYRRISTSNSSYRESLDGVFGHVELLAAVGFIQKPENTCFEYKWHNLPSNLIESSKTRDDGDGAGETGISRPKSLVEAMVLLEEAVSLLSALQISKETLLETISKSMAKDNVEQQEEVKSCESQSVAFVPSDTASNTPLSSNSVPTPSAAVTESSHIQPHDELISVTVLSTTESSGNLGDDSIIGENAESFDGSLDFMKIMQMAQAASVTTTPSKVP